jgi:superfamily II DNA or RNA helicase
MPRSSKLQPPKKPSHHGNNHPPELEYQRKVIEELQKLGDILNDGLPREIELENRYRMVWELLQSKSINKVEQAQYLISISRDRAEEAQKTAICYAIRLLYPYFPRDGQRDALHHLIYRKQDLILIAKTSFGKSMILQALSVLVDKSITIVILPLDQIGKEQQQYIERIGGRPCFLNADNISKELLREIEAARYTHLLMSPELANSQRLRGVLEAPKFKDQVSLIVIDEAHLVEQWGVKFRIDYARLNELRVVIGRQVPWFACSATLAPLTLKAIIKGIGFDADIKVQRTSIDRPELLLRTGVIPRISGQKYTALRFVFDPDSMSSNMARVKSTDIKKTIVFFDSKRDVYSAHEACTVYLQQHPQYQYGKQEALRIVQVFTRDTHVADKDDLIKEFRKPGSKSSVRVIFATEALGIGADLPDVRRVVQYGIPIGRQPSVLWQRGGRACRDGEFGEIILLVQQWAVGKERIMPSDRSSETTVVDPDDSDKDDASGDDNSDISDGDISPAKRQTKSGILDAKKRGKLPEFWWKLINTPMCMRDTIWEHFQEPSESRHGVPTDRCCSRCQSEYNLNLLNIDNYPRYYTYNEKGLRANEFGKQIGKAVRAWADQKAPVLYRNVVFESGSACFLSTSQEEQLERYGPQIFTYRDLEEQLNQWPHLDVYGEDLLSVIRSCRINPDGSSQTSALLNSQVVIIPHTPSINAISASQPASMPVHRSNMLAEIAKETQETLNRIPASESRISGHVNLQPTSQEPETPSRDLLSTPHLSDLTQLSSSSNSLLLATPITPSGLNQKRRRQPLGEITANLPNKRRQTSKR